MSLKNNLKILVMLLLLILPALYYGLGVRPIYKIQEVRIAETAREMVVSGDWLVPRYNGELRLQKPPLPYWLTAASYRLFGINEMAVRLPALLFGVLTTFLLFVWAKRELGEQIAANTVLILVTSYIGLRYFRSGEADATLLFFISAATLLGYRILQGEVSHRQQLLFYAALGLGFLTKGPAAIAVPVLTVIAFAFQQKRLAALKLWLNPAWLNLLGLIVFMLLAFGWYAWILGYMPDAAQHFMGKQVDETFISGTHAKPFWWYLAHITEFYAPWSLLLIPMSYWYYRHRSLPVPMRFALVWLAVVFVLLTFTVNKQMQYALLFAPPITILLGYYLEHASAGFAQFNRGIFWLLWLALLAMIVYAFKKHVAAELLSLAWPLIILLPLFAKRLMAVPVPSYPILLVAGLAVAAYIYAEQNLAIDAEKTQVQALMKKAKHYTPLYQASPGDGAVSYYAGRVVPPIKEQDINQLLQQKQEFWLIAEQKPELRGALVWQQKIEDGITLWKLSLAQ
jgi:4-amino-4-deoxy-L-arabinose transferase-like glycosyltransferase